MRKARIPVLIAWIFCALVSVLSIYDLALELGTNDYSGRPALVAYGIVERLLPMLFAVPAALIISHQPRNIIGWLLMTPVLVAVSVSWPERYFQSLQSPPPATPVTLLLLLFTSAAWVWVIFPILLIPLVFPTGRPPSPRWNWVAYLAIGMVVFFFTLAIFSTEVVLDGVSWTMKNPIGFIGNEIWDKIMPVWSILLVLLTVVSLASIIIRYRKGTVVEREQIKWLLYGFAIFVIAYIPATILNSSEYIMSDIGDFLFILSIAVMPAAITAAILRYKLFDIDVIIRLTLVYAVVTALLVAVYVGGIVVTQAAFRALTGQTSDVAVLVTTLAITVLFNPVRRQVQQGIDRRFYRQKYDAVQALAEFATAARGGSDLDALTDMLVETVSKTLQPTQVGLYMKGQAPHRDGQSDS